ncbi:15740_t:CDS:2 [Cetraspora pellucida]|uniref:15740_t:CDS:1 n=1 Tax=Cetraspora pellucida TaxID=1433469 RepID=A0A9N9GUE4_9GLOM|nr:15740_t:CDS:2 [Cetraspora pellucida]
MDSLPPIEPTVEQYHTLSVDTLTHEKRRLENSVNHLIRSNEEMKNFDENDADFQLAIKENEIFISKQQEKINLIQNILVEKQQNGSNCIPLDSDSSATETAATTLDDLSDIDQLIGDVQDHNNTNNV